MKKMYPLLNVSLECSNRIQANLKRNDLIKWQLRLLLCIALMSSFNNNLFADVTVTSSAVAASNINQGTNNNVVYIAQLSVTTTAVVMNNVQFTLGGTHDANDLETVLVYFNASSPTFAGSTFIGSAAATFAAPHTYSINVSRSLAVGSEGYLLIVANVSPTATDNNTILLNGATNPVIFGFTTATTVTNSQTNIAGAQTIQAADITLTTSAVAASDINQGTNNNMIYIAQMSVTTEPVVVNNIQFNLTGTHDANDLETVLVYFNASNPTFAGSTFIGSAAATFAAPHTYSININRSMAIGSEGYFMVVTNVSPTATDNNTININGVTNPITFGFTTAPNITNSQTNIAGAQTIQASDITVTSSAVAASDVNQGTNNNMIYITQMSVATEPVVVNNIQFNLTGTHDASDLETVLVYFNASNPTFAGSTFIGSAAATFAAPHTYSININRSMAIGSTGYFMIVANVSPTATDNNTININGTTNPITFGFTTAPNITNTQTNIAGIQTIQAADITLTSSAVAASDINQGTNNNMVYIAQMSVITEPVVVNNIQFTLSGTHDASDLETVLIYFNASNPTFAGSTFIGSAAATFAAPHAYSININRSMAIGSTGYFMIVINVSPTATDNNTININGATNPITFGFTTAPNITNTQTNIAGIQTIQAADITVTSSAVAASDINQGTNNNMIYIAQMSVTTEPVVVNNIQFNLTGTHDANDLETVLVYFNASNPTFAGSTFIGSAAATFAAPHAYSININRSMAIGSSGYFMILANVSPTATDNNTININGATNPITFGFTTAPNITNSQTNIAGIQTIQAADISIGSLPVPTNIFPSGSNNNLVYIAQMTVATQPVVVNNIQFNLAGTHDANDLETVLVYFNASNPTFAGSTFIGSAAATFAAPHAYSININRSMAIGSSGYFLILTNVAPASTTGNTVLINGATNPVVFGFTTAPNITNTQADNGGLHTLPVSFISVNAAYKSGNVEVEWKVGAEVNITKYIVERSGDGRTFTYVGEVPATTNSANNKTYELVDNSPLPGNNFYRIVASGQDGKVQYSPIVKVSTGALRPAISIYPNPVITNRKLNIALQNLDKAIYQMAILNQQGQRVALRTIDHIGGNSVFTFSLPASAPGVYTLEIRNTTQKFVKTFIVE